MNIPLIEQYKRIQARHSALVELDQAIENCFEKDRELNFLPPKVYERLYRTQMKLHHVDYKLQKEASELFKTFKEIEP